MTRVVLADGTVVNDCSIGITASGIWVNARGMDIVRAAQLFSDPARTQTMRFEYGDMYDEVKDFTQVSVFNCDDPQVIKIRMVGGTVTGTGCQEEVDNGSNI